MIKWNRHSYNMPKYDFLLILIVLIMLCIFAICFFYRLAMLDDIENVRIYWDFRPCNIRHLRLSVGTNAYFDEIKPCKYFVESHIPSFADFSRWYGKSVLEIRL